MREEIIRQIRVITKEEQEILQGQKLNRKRYTSKADFEIDSQKMLERGQLIDIRPHTRFVAFPRHTHNYVEIIYMLKGSTRHCVQDSLTVELEEGDLLFLNQHASHSIEAAGEEDLAVNFIVLPQFFDVAFSMLDEENELKNFLADTLTRDSERAGYLHYKVAGELQIQNLLENMIWTIRNQTGNAVKINQVTMGLLLLHLMNCTDRLEYHDRLQQEKQITMKALHYIEENYRDASLGWIAARENLSIYQLSRMIKKQTGYTFKELLQIRRLTRAAQLLSQTQLPVSDIIAAVGYDNTSYFFRVFREKYHVSPREYRIKSRQTVSADSE
ncbi:MAG: helix-turn-helix domain-containing protein [Lachnospiraceae bacterium]|nr:helix-turn-helix domain-containing protein [Lachnospiraceae bacterium]